jgi:UDP-GlcNAc:undecaprenyl-phosphate GlcNAc-1-phosphate transferase
MSGAVLSSFADARLALAFAVAFLLSPLLAFAARRIGWGDAPTLARKLQREAVPTVGGLALLAALAVGPPETARTAPWLAPERAPWAIGLALVLVFFTGAIDDRRALGPGAKVGLQLAALLPLVLVRASESGTAAWVDAAALLLAGLVALNLLNTFDNADGAVLGTACLGALFASPALCAACAGILPWNLDADRAGRRSARAPTLYLGDAGVNVLALCIALRPAAWPILWIPALDLLRLSWIRWRAGSRPWIGDRRHLAHRLLAAGLGSRAVALVLALLSLPGALGWALEARWRGAGPAGLLAGALAFALALRSAPESPVRDAT